MTNQRDALLKAKEAFTKAAECLANPDTVGISDVIWFSNYETLYDHLIDAAESITAALAEPKTATPEQKDTNIPDEFVEEIRQAAERQ